jgi:hypothetical protein
LLIGSTQETTGTKLSTSVLFNYLMFSCESIGPIGTKLNKNVHWMVL